MGVGDKENRLYDVTQNEVKGLLCHLSIEYDSLRSLIFGHLRSTTPQEWVNAHEMCSKPFINYFMHIKHRRLQVCAILAHERGPEECFGLFTYLTEESQEQLAYFDNEASCREHAMKNATGFPRVAYIWRVGSCPQLISPKELTDFSNDAAGGHKGVNQQTQSEWEKMENAFTQLLL